MLGLDFVQSESGPRAEGGSQEQACDAPPVKMDCRRAEYDDGRFGGIFAIFGRALVRWHLLSLDAPTVAAVWTSFVARCARLQLPWTVTAAMFVAVWLLYAADRLLDGRGEEDGRERELEERHRFHRAHRREFGIVMLAALGLLVPLVAAIAVLPGSAFWPFLRLGAALAAWFGVIHLARPLSSLRGAKELVPGLFFGAAIFLPTFARAPELRFWLWIAAVAFGAVCWLNCRLIHRWEHVGSGRGTPVLIAALGVVCVGVAAVRLEPMTPVLLAVCLAAAALLWLDCVRGRLRRTTLRAAADLALLTPLVVMAWVK